MRIFRRVSKYVGNTSVKSKINRYEWTRSRGLFVVYTDGLRAKSEYSLRELLSKDKPEGEIVEVTEEG